MYQVQGVCDVLKKCDTKKKSKNSFNLKPLDPNRGFMKVLKFVKKIL